MKRFFSVVGAFIIATGMSCALFTGLSYADALDGSEETDSDTNINDTESGDTLKLTYVGEEYYDQEEDINFSEVIQATDEEGNEFALSDENTKCGLSLVSEEVSEEGYQTYELACEVSDPEGNALGELTQTIYIKAAPTEGEVDPTPDPDEDDDGNDEGGDNGDDNGDGGDDSGDTGDEGDGTGDGNKGDGDSEDSGDGGDNSGTTDPTQPGDSGDNQGTGTDKPGDSGNDSGDSGDDGNNGGDNGNSDDNQGNQGSQNDDQNFPTIPGVTDSDGDGLPDALPTTGGDSIFNRIPKSLLYSLIFGFIVASIVYYRTDRVPATRKQTR